MLDKLFSMFGFTGSQNYVGLSQVVENNIKTEQKVNKIQKKELKLSDLMRGN